MQARQLPCNHQRACSVELRFGWGQRDIRPVNKKNQYIIVIFNTIIYLLKIQDTHKKIVYGRESKPKKDKKNHNIGAIFPINTFQKTKIAMCMFTLILLRRSPSKKIRYADGL